MLSTLTKICALQPKYSSSNTEDMQERGRLIRSELAEELRARLPALQKAFSPVFDDLAVEGSDGIGRKTEAPWVRLYSKAMSPTPRDGFYLVIHFAANGSAVFVTVGCGSTTWEGGDLRAVSDEELIRRTSWGRTVVTQKWGALDPFDDQIRLGARAPLPRTFEKATAFAKRLDVSDLATADLDRLLYSASERLNEIYVAQLEERDVSPGVQDTYLVEAISKPLKKLRRRQGRGLDAKERKAVEIRAMSVAVEHLKSEGFTCQDTSATESFDLIATKNGDHLMVEVKGTTSDLCESILMTKNEVELHRKYKGSTGLLIVTGIKLQQEDHGPVGHAGVVEALLSWDIDEWSAEPIAYQVSRR